MRGNDVRHARMRVSSNNMAIEEARGGIDDPSTSVTGHYRDLPAFSVTLKEFAK